MGGVGVEGGGGWGVVRWRFFGFAFVVDRFFFLSFFLSLFLFFFIALFSALEQTHCASYVSK